MDAAQLIKTAQDLVDNKRGLLASDESDGTIKKRFDTIGLESSSENHRRYRELLYTTPGLEEFIGGAIMFDETIRQTASDGTPFTKLLSDKGIMPGIKVDAGKVDLANFDGDFITEGLDGLRERLADYSKLGARFTKWRAVFKVSESTPSRTSINSNVENLSRFAALSQEAGLVPIVEPEVLMDGNHDVEKCAVVTEQVNSALVARLFDHKVKLAAVILKANMVLPGKDSPQKLSDNEIAKATVTSMRNSVSVAIPSIVFLSGGQSPTEATNRLNEINKLKSHPWEMNFSYGRALQEPVLENWQGKDENKESAQKALLKRARLNSLALSGKYDPKMEDD